MKNAFIAIAGAIGTLGLGTLFYNATQDAIRYESALGQINRLMADSADEFQAWGEANRDAMGMSRLGLVQYGATYANLLSSFTNSTQQTTKFTQDLLKASAIISASNPRFGLEDTMERIRSGLLGETDAIEDLGININVAMIEATNAFRQFAGDKSWEQLDFKTQGLIRYFAILEQASQKYGVELTDNTALRQAQFIAQLNDMRLSLGQIITPIYNAVLPALTAFSESIANALGWLANLSQALFGTNFEATAQAATNASNAVSQIGSGATGAAAETEKAAKAMTGALAGFDEINNISKKGAAGGGAGGGVGAGLVTGIDNALKESQSGTKGLSKEFEEMADRIREAFDRIFPQEYRDRITYGIDRVKEAFGDLRQSVEDISDNPAFEKIAKWLSNIVSSTITGNLLSLAGAFQMLSGVLTGIDGILSGDFEQAWDGAEQIVSGFYDLINGFVYKISPEWGDAMKGFKESFSEAWQGIKADITAYGDPTKLEFTDFLYYIRDKAAEVWSEVMEAAGNWWGDIRDNISDNWDGLKEDAEIKFTEIGLVLAVAWETFLTVIQWDRMKERANQVWEDMKTGAKTGLENVRKTASDTWTSFLTFIKWDDVKNRASKVWTDTKAGAQTAWDEIRTAVGERWDGIVSKVSDKTKFTAVIDYFRKDFKDDWAAAWRSVGDTLGEIWEGFYDVIKRPLNRVIGLINEFIESLNKLSVKMPAIPGISDAFEIGFNIPAIPKLANGGITDVNSPFLAMVGDNKTQREVVAPLGDLQNMITSAVGTAMLSVMQLNGGAASTSNQPTEAVFNIDGTNFARAILPALLQEMNRQGMRIVTNG